jgi:hypothetical protein
MLRKFVTLMTVAAFSAGLLMAHGDPLLGTVTKVEKDVVTIKSQKDGKEVQVQVMVDSKTKYMIGTKAAKLADVKVGEKVSIDAMMDTKMKMYVAESITLPAAATKAAATTTAKPTTTTSTKSKTPATK